MEKAFLRNVLIGNAMFSLISGIALLIASSRLAIIIGVPTGYWLTYIGLGLLFFVGFIGLVLRKGMPRNWVNAIIIQDIIWVVASIYVLSLNPWNISNTGLILIAVVAIIVGVFAFLQIKYSGTGIVKN